MLKKSIIAFTLASILTGCGSSSDNASSTDTPVAAVAATYTVIDGYLSDAEVYVVSQSDSTEILIGTTDANGQIQIPAKYKDFTVVAKVIAGKTTDSDTAGFVAKSYEMRGTADSAVITPFTTLANINNTSLTDLAAALGLEVADISSDYATVANGKAHLVARTLAAQLDEDNSDDDAAVLQTLATKAVNYVNTLTGDLNNVELNVDTNSSNPFSSQVRVASVSDFIEDGELTYLTSFSQYYSKKEGIQTASFSNGKMSLTEGTEVTEVEYTIEGNKLTTAEGSEDFIYVSEELALAVTPQNDLIVWSKGDLNKTTDFTESDVLGKTWYYMDDDSQGQTTHVDAFTATLDFDPSDNIFTAHFSGEDKNGTYYLDDGILSLVIGEETLKFKKSYSNENMIVILGADNNKPAMFLADENFAASLVGKWVMSAQ